MNDDDDRMNFIHLNFSKKHARTPTEFWISFWFEMIWLYVLSGCLVVSRTCVVAQQEEERVVRSVHDDEIVGAAKVRSYFFYLNWILKPSCACACVCTVCVARIDQALWFWDLQNAFAAFDSVRCLQCRWCIFEEQVQEHDNCLAFVLHSWFRLTPLTNLTGTVWCRLGCSTPIYSSNFY